MCALGECTCPNRVGDKVERAMMAYATYANPSVEDIYEQLMHVSYIGQAKFDENGTGERA